MGHAGKFIKAYFDTRAPQAQVQLFPLGGGYDVVILRNGAQGLLDRVSVYYRGGACLKQFVQELLAYAGYQKKTGDNGEIYYG